MEPLTIHQAEQALQYVDPGCDRDTWFSVAGALKSEFGENGKDLFASWSSAADNYDKGACESTWRSARAGHFSIGTLIKLARDAGWQRSTDEMSVEKKRTLRVEQERRRAARQSDIEADEAMRLAMQQAVAGACQSIWESHTQGMGRSAYLGAKDVSAHGIRFFKRAGLLVIDDSSRCCEVKTGNDIRAFFSSLPVPRPDHVSFLKLDSGAIAVPMRDIEGKVWSIQTVNAQGTKMFPKYSRKKGLFHLLGELGEHPYIGFAEGYATAATAYELGDGWPVVACFDSGNLFAVADAMRDAGWLVGKTPIWFADNDPVNTKTGKRAGQDSAETCKDEFGGIILVPDMPVQEAS